MFAVLGLLLILLTLLDIFWTTMGEGGGPLTRFIARRLWRGFLFIHRSGCYRLTAVAGISIVLIAVMLWLLLLWLGWTLVFSAGESAVVNAQTGRPADFWEKFYFIGHTLFTLGVGDFRPSGMLWQMFTPVATLSGLFMVTFAITYIIPMVSAASHKRALALYLETLGRTPQDILLRHWNGTGFGTLEDHLPQLTMELAVLHRNHLVYPMLAYFHGSQAEDAIMLRAAALDEALTIIECGLHGRHHPYMARGAFEPPRQVLLDFFAAVGDIFLHSEEKTRPRRPSIGCATRTCRWSARRSSRNG